MIKKTILIALFVLFAGALIAGGIYRTSAKSGYEISLAGEKIIEISQSSNEGAAHNGQGAAVQDHQQDGERAGQGLGSGGAAQGRNQKTETYAGEGSANGQGGSQGRGGQGQESQNEPAEDQRGQGQGNGRLENSEQESQNGQGNQGAGQGRNRQAESAEVQESIIIEGTIVQAPAAGVDMIIETAAGQVLVGTGPGYLQEQGFDLLNGQEVQVSGYFENDEFKAAAITRLIDGEAIALRDEFGRPMWSGAARNAQGDGGQGNGQTS